jgi:hypothetical protein
MNATSKAIFKYTQLTQCGNHMMGLLADKPLNTSKHARL